MQSNWTWFAFIGDTAFSKLRSAIGRASESIGGPVIIQLEAGIVQDPATFEPHAPRPQRDTVAFESSGGTLNLTKAETPSELLRTLAKARVLKN
jgi:hypothetical protein